MSAEKVKYEVSIVVEVEASEPDFEIATAVQEASYLLTARSEGFEDDNVVIHVLEVP